jgi:hypothetical protein
MAAADRQAGSPAPLQTPSPGQRCSVLSEAAQESAYGTAPPVTTWFALEQPGPWGRDAPAESHLGSDLGRALGEAVKAVGGRFALIRRPGHHPDNGARRPRRVLLAHCRPYAEWLLTATVTDPAQLHTVDFTALGLGDLNRVSRSLQGARVEERPQLLVCTNGRRDVCCAVRGRPVAEAAASTHPGQVWETSHTGGHRFAPTAVLLPSGLLLGRITPPEASSALTAVENGAFPIALSGPQHDRGRCALAPPAQVAESAVRHRLATAQLNSLQVTAGTAAGTTSDASQWHVEHADGRRWEVSVVPAVTGAPRPVSCGRAEQLQHGYRVRIAATDEQATSVRQ